MQLNSVSLPPKISRNFGSCIRAMRLALSLTIRAVSELNLLLSSGANVIIKGAIWKPFWRAAQPRKNIASPRVYPTDSEKRRATQFARGAFAKPCRNYVMSMFTSFSGWIACQRLSSVTNPLENRLIAAPVSYKRLWPFYFNRLFLLKLFITSLSDPLFA